MYAYLKKLPLFSAFSTSDWGNSNDTTNWIGPENITNLPETCQFKAFREHEQNISALLPNITG